MDKIKYEKTKLKVKSLELQNELLQLELKRLQLCEEEPTIFDLTSFRSCG